MRNNIVPGQKQQSQLTHSRQKNIRPTKKWPFQRGALQYFNTDSNRHT